MVREASLYMKRCPYSKFLGKFLAGIALSEFIHICISVHMYVPMRVDTCTHVHTQLLMGIANWYSHHRLHRKSLLSSPD